jgi:hypothetical protein
MPRSAAGSVYRVVDLAQWITACTPTWRFAPQLIEMRFFEFVYATRLIQPKVISHGVLRSARQLGNQRVRQTMTFQPEHFHATLDNRMRMAMPFVVERLLYFGREFELVLSWRQ